MDNDRQRYKLPDFVIETTSMLAGAKAAYEAGDPSAGEAVADYVKNRIYNLVNLFTSRRQYKRITDVTEFALNEIRRRLEADEKLRDDGFFDKTIDRSDAEEVFEEVLLKARDEPQEKKIPYIGRLFENGCFDESIDSGTLHFLCKESENLTYRQLCIIKIAHEMRERRYPLRSNSFQDLITIKDIRRRTTPEQFSTLIECVVLRDKGYLAFSFSTTPGIELEVLKYIIPNTMESLPTGTMMYEHMNLKSIPETDVLPVIHALS